MPKRTVTFELCEQHYDFFQELLAQAQARLHGECCCQCPDCDVTGEALTSLLIDLLEEAEM